MCGNLGLLLWGCRPEDARALLDHLERMADATAVRGAQGGGIGCCSWQLAGQASEPRRRAGEDATTREDLKSSEGKGEDLAGGDPESGGLLREYHHEDPTVPPNTAASFSGINDYAGFGAVLPDDPGGRPGYDPQLQIVHVLGRKRRSLSAMLCAKARASFHFGRRGSTPLMALSFIGHTRFATGSHNRIEEMHPHDWGSPSRERVWHYVPKEGFVETLAEFGVQTTHNGDFDALDAFDLELSNGKLGSFLNVFLSQPCHLKGDSPKIAGFLKLARVQGRLAAAARLAFLRIANSITEVMAAPFRWEEWEAWETHILAPVLRQALKEGKVIEALRDQPGRYRVRSMAVGALAELGVAAVQRFRGKGLSPAARARDASSAHALGELASLGTMGALRLRSFLRHAFRGFLHNDTMNAVTELLARAKGTFGIQAHCTLEAGVVILAAKGQPMSFAFDPHSPVPLVTFGSEDNAVRALPTLVRLPSESQSSDRRRMFSLDEEGEVVRIGAVAPHADENRYTAGGTDTIKAGASPQEHFFVLRSGVQIRVYNLGRGAELPVDLIRQRSTPLRASECRLPDSLGGVDVRDPVEGDLRDVASVVDAIDAEWMPTVRHGPLPLGGFELDPASRSSSVSAGIALCHELVNLATQRRSRYANALDLLIGGTEVSLWAAQQFASDLRLVFPGLSVACVSSNQLVGIFTEGRKKVVFPSAGPITAEMLCDRTCFLMVSQSGQTFPTLHATKVFCSRFPTRVWTLTGEPSSKMQQAVAQGLARAGVEHHRIIVNGSGSRPAEPTSVAAVAVHHTLTHVLFQSVHLMHDYCVAARVIQRRFGGSGGALKPASEATCPCDAQHLSRELCRLAPDCLQDLESMVVPAMAFNLGVITGAPGRKFCGHGGSRPGGSRGAGVDETTHASLVAVGHRWARHVTETWRLCVAAFFYVLITVAAGVPLVSTALNLVGLAFDVDGSFSAFAAEPFAADGTADRIFFGLGWAARVLDALIYVYFGLLLARILRLVEGRHVFSRLGSRTVVIVDTPMVHRMLEAFLSKLFSQAYSFVSVNVHGGCGVDDMVHLYTHRVVRGVLMAVGRVDGRLSALSKTEMATLLSCRQARFIENPDLPGHTGPEVVSVGHNPYVDANLEDVHITLPSDFRRPFLDQYIYHAIVTEPSEERMRESMVTLTKISEDLVQQEHFKAQQSFAKRRRRRRTPSALPFPRNPLYLAALTSRTKLPALERPTAMPLETIPSEEIVPFASRPQLAGPRPRVSFVSRDSEGSVKQSWRSPLAPLSPAMEPRASSLDFTKMRTFMRSPMRSPIRSPVRRLDSVVREGGRIGDLARTPPEVEFVLPVGLHYLHSNLFTSSTDNVKLEAVANVPLNNEEAKEALADEDEAPPKPTFTRMAYDTQRRPSLFARESLNSITKVDRSMLRKLKSMASERELARQRSNCESEVSSSATAPRSAGMASTNSRDRSRRDILSQIGVSSRSLSDMDFAKWESFHAGFSGGDKGAELARHTAGSAQQEATPLGAQAEAAFTNDAFAPNQLLAFYGALSKEWEKLQEHQALVQRLFESRAATVERFVAFCVVFHTMAAECSEPWFCKPWPVDKSQSNMRVATTAAPVPASDADLGHADVIMEVKAICRRFSVRMTGSINNF